MSKNASSAEGKAIPFIILEDEKLKVCDEAKDFLSTVSSHHVREEGEDVGGGGLSSAFTLL